MDHQFQQQSDSCSGDDQNMNDSGGTHTQDNEDQPSAYSVLADMSMSKNSKLATGTSKPLNILESIVENKA